MTAPLCKGLKCFGNLSAREVSMKHGIVGKLLSLSDNSVISLGPGEPDFPTPQPILNYGSRLLARGIGTHYSSPAGRIELKNELVKKLRRDNKIRTSTDNIIVTSGSQEALLLALISIVDQGEEVIVPTPSYMGYQPTIEFLGGKLKEVPLKQEENFDLDVDRIKKAVTKKTRAIILCNPSNPTGMIYSKKNCEELSDLAVDKGLFIISDEAYEKIIYSDKKFNSFGCLNGMKDHTITLQTFSKSYAMCGFRVGYAVAPKKVVDAMASVHINTSIAAPTISQMMATYALTLSDVHTKKMVSAYKRRRDLMVRRLNELGLKTLIPEGTFYAFSNTTHLGNSEQVGIDLLRKAKVAALPGTEFGKYGEGFMRFSYATSPEKINTAMNRIERYLKR